MSDNQEMLDKLKKLMSLKLSKAKYATRLGISVEEVNKLFAIIYNKKRVIIPKVLASSYTTKVNAEKGTLESTRVTNFEPKSVEELASIHKIDLKTYKITNYWSKLLPNGNFTSSVFCKQKDKEDYTIKDFSEFLINYKTNYIPLDLPKQSTDKPYVDVEISLSDYHLAKKHIDGDNSPSARVERYLSVVRNLLSKIKSIYNINTLVFPISNDFFHTDNYQNQTTNGTPQDVIMDYSKEYELGFELLVNSILLMLDNAEEVQVVLVQGNHDRTKSFYLAHALETYFKNEGRVSFQREHGVVKGIMLGQTFIGYHHGNCKINDLPLLFATHPEYCNSFGKAKYREVHTGDKHHYMAKEVKGVRIQQMPSLSGTDRWHLDNNYVHSIRAALALIYDSINGKCAEFEERI